MLPWKMVIMLVTVVMVSVVAMLVAVVVAGRVVMSLMVVIVLLVFGSNGGWGMDAPAFNSCACFLDYVQMHFTGIHFENLSFCPHWSWERFCVVFSKGRYIHF